MSSYGGRVSVQRGGICLLPVVGGSSWAESKDTLQVKKLRMSTLYVMMVVGESQALKISEEGSVAPIRSRRGLLFPCFMGVCALLYVLDNFGTYYSALHFLVVHLKKDHSHTYRRVGLIYYCCSILLGCKLITEF